MNAAVLQALIAAGIKPESASRLASAIDQAYKPGPATSVFDGTSSNAVSPDAGESGSYALFASGPASVQGNGPAFGRGKAALGVRGLAVVNGEVYATETVYAQDLNIRGDCEVDGLLHAGDLSSGGGLVVTNTLAASPEISRFASPLVSDNVFVSQRAAQFAGDNLFVGPITIRGAVNWNGVREPKQIGVLSFVNANGGSVLNVVRKEVAVLNDFADVNGKLSFSVDSLPGDTFLTAATASTGTQSINNVTAATFNATSATQSLTVITAVGFNAAACAITTETTTVTVLVGCGGTISMQSSAVPVVSSVSIATAGTTSRRLLSGGIKIDAS